MRRREAPFSPYRDYYKTFPWYRGITVEQDEAFWADDDTLSSTCKTDDEYAAKSAARDERWLHFH